MRGGNIKKNILLISSLMPVFSKITFANVFETLGGVVTNAASISLQSLAPIAFSSIPGIYAAAKIYSMTGLPGSNVAKQSTENFENSLRGVWNFLTKEHDITNVPLLGGFLSWVGKNDIGNGILKYAFGINVDKKTGRVTTTIGDTILNALFVFPIIGIGARALGVGGRALATTGRFLRTIKIWSKILKFENIGNKLIKLGNALKNIRPPYIKITKQIALDFGHNYSMIKEGIRYLKYFKNKIFSNKIISNLTTHIKLNSFVRNLAPKFYNKHLFNSLITKIKNIKPIDRLRWPGTLPHINIGSRVGKNLIPVTIKGFKVPHFIPGPAIPISIRVCKSIFSSIRIYINNRKK